jgi:hypothetical protein
MATPFSVFYHYLIYAMFNPKSILAAKLTAVSPPWNYHNEYADLYLRMAKDTISYPHYQAG